MPKRKEPELKPEEQFERFVETARKLGVDETGKDFEEAFKRLAPTYQAESESPTSEVLSTGKKAK